MMERNEDIDKSNNILLQKINSINSRTNVNLISN
jgi:hypothetical protein